MSFKIGFQHQLGALTATVVFGLAGKALIKFAEKLSSSLDDSSSDENTIEEHIEENSQNNTFSPEIFENNRETLERLAKSVEVDVDNNDHIEETPQTNHISRETLERISDIFMDLDEDNEKKEEEK